MRAMACCLLMLGLVGCQSGPRWFMRDQTVSGRATYSGESPADSSNKSDNDRLSVPPSPGDYEQSTRTRKAASANQQAARSKTATGTRKPSTGSASRSTQLANKKPGTSTKPTTVKPTAQDENVKQLMADLEKTKREKATLQTKLSEETAKQTQQRLELEARMTVLQDQLRQQSALQQVAYQQQAQAMARPNVNYGSPMNQNYNPNQNYNGPVITSGAPSPGLSSSASTNNGGGYGGSAPNVPAWNNAPTSNWNAPAPAWNTPAPSWNSSSATPTQSQVEMWPHSPQRR